MMVLLTPTDTSTVRTAAVKLPEGDAPDAHGTDECSKTGGAVGPRVPFSILTDAMDVLAVQALC